MLSKKLVSIIGATIISMSLVGCQSTQNTEIPQEVRDEIKEELKKELKKELEEPQEEVEEIKEEVKVVYHKCCDCGKDTNDYYSIISDYMCSDCASYAQCYGCGIELPLSKMFFYSGRSFRCESCYEEEYNTEVLSENEQKQLNNSQQYDEPGYEADHCEHCSSRNIEIMDNAGGYICNDCGGM